MNGIHDMGGMHGFGPIERDDATIHHEWERRVVGVARSVRNLHLFSLDAFRYAIERLPPAEYLGSTYFARWRKAIETLLLERGILTRSELDERYQKLRRGDTIRESIEKPRVPKASHQPGFYREVDERPRYRVGDQVRARNLHPKGHTRLPRYVRGKLGTIARVYPAYVFPDTLAHDAGENPQYLYNVRFDGRTLWGPDAEPSTSVGIDLFESYLEPAGDA